MSSVTEAYLIGIDYAISMAEWSIKYNHNVEDLLKILKENKAGYEAEKDE